MLIRFIYLTILGAALTLGPTAAALEAQEANGAELSLYERLGGYDVIAAVVDDFFERFDTDPELMPFLGGINAAEGARIRQHFVDFICARTGGPCLYLGRDMKEAHEGLPITDSHFDRVMRHLRDALDNQDVPERAKRELTSMLNGLRAEITTR